MTDGNRNKDVTARVQTINDSMRVPKTELEEAVERHVEVSEQAQVVALDLKRAARTRSLSPRPMKKVVPPAFEDVPTKRIGGSK